MQILVSLFLFAWVCFPSSCSGAGATEVTRRDLQSSVPAVRRQAASSLGLAGDRSAVPALIEALMDSDSSVRRESAKALAALRDERAVTALRTALCDADSNVRVYAAYALGEIKDVTAASALIAALRDPEWCVRDQAAWALRELHEPEIIGPLVTELKETDADEAHIVWVLRQFGGARTRNQILPLLMDPDPKQRIRGIHVLAQFGEAQVVEPLIAALQDKDPEVRRCVIGALCRLGDQRARTPLEQLVVREKDASVREAAARAAFEMSPQKYLAAWWSFEDRNTKRVKDMTGHGNDGQIVACRPVEGKVQSALMFGQGAYVELGRPAGLPIGGRPFTIMAWVKSEANDGVVVARGGASCGYSLYLKNGVAKFGIHLERDGLTGIAAGRGNVVGAWRHLAGVVKQKRIELYVDGQLAATAKTDGYIPGNCGQGMEIGYDTGNSPVEIVDHFQGIIDEVKVYDTALSEAEIARQFQEQQ